MPLFSLGKSREPRSARERPVRQVRPRVRLNKEELRATSTLMPKERTIAYVLAAFGAVGLTAAVIGNGFDDNGPVLLALSFALSAVLVAAARWGNRLTTGIAAVCFAFGPWGGFVLGVFPFLAFQVWIMFSMTNDRRRLMEEKIRSGVVDEPASAARGTRSRARRGESSEAEAADKKPYAPPSKRYTPPKGTGRRR